MNKLQVIVSTCIPVLLAIVACSAPNGSSGAASPVPSESPAPVQQTGKSLVYNFDTDTVGKLPAKFHAALTGKGSTGTWEVKADSTAPSQRNVLAQTSPDKTS